MRRLFMAAAFVLAAAGGAGAQDVVAPNAAIEGTIRSQIEAFQADDFARAFTFASPSIQNMFRTPENFGAMVRNGYPMVWRPEDLRFGDLREITGALWQTVIVTDAQGVVHALAYRMEQRDGAWLISAVQMIPPPEVSA